MQEQQDSWDSVPDYGAEAVQQVAQERGLSLRELLHIWRPFDV